MLIIESSGNIIRFETSILRSKRDNCEQPIGN